MITLWQWAGLALSVAALPVVAAVGYLVGLSVLSLGSSSSRRERTRPIAPRDATFPGTRFVVVVPAHDEGQGVAATVASVLTADYPSTLRSVLVVADNCTDDTAAAARGAGARVMERFDPERRGKGHALSWAFAHLIAEGDADAVVVIDADSVISAGLLRAFDARIRSGEHALQADYGARNPDASWRTRLMAISLSAYHRVRSLGRERLGLSCGLRGNGMGFTVALLVAVPHRVSSLVEDVEYGIQLGLAGQRVAFVSKAEVRGEMPSSAAASASQRRRWESGRASMVRRYVLPLLRQGVSRVDAIALDLAMDLLVPPLAGVAVVTASGLLLSLGLTLAPGGTFVPATALWGASAVGLTLHALRGWQLSGTGSRGLWALAHVPRYVVWKLTLKLRPGTAPPEEWVRTVREGEAS